ncbi:MAG: hypothetical protein R2713_18225 [Ilumatobacteraceae bacterium]
MALVSPSVRASTQEQVRAALTRRDRNPAGIVLQVLLLTAILVTLLILFTLLVRLISPAMPVFRDRGVDFLTGTIGSDPDKVGIWPGIYGSFFIGLGILVVSIPLGVAAAIFLEEYAHDRGSTASSS